MMILYQVPSVDTLIAFIILISFALFIVLPTLIDFKGIWIYIKNKTYEIFTGKTLIKTSPKGLSYILKSLGFDEKNIKKISIINNKRKKKIHTYFAYEIDAYTKKFQIYYFVDVDKENGNEPKWMFYKKGSFSNKPARIKDHYYDILKSINIMQFNRLKNKFKSRLLENQINI
jgi:hypothetical protein